MKSYTFLSAVLLVLCVLAVAHAATFNVNFNNVEQGANSTSSPSLNVVNGRRVEDGPAITVPVPSGNSSGEDSSARPAGNASQTEFAQVGPQTRHFQLDTTAFMTGGGPELAGRPGVAASITWYPWRYVGLRAYTGLIFGDRYLEGFRGDFLIENTQLGRSRLLAGAELEVVPLHVDLFGARDWLSLGAFGGVSTLAYRSAEPLSLAHVGARARMRLGDTLGLLANMRVNLEYFSFETGLSFSF